MGNKCRFVRSEAESQSIRQVAETDGGAAPPISKIPGPSGDTRKVGWPYVAITLTIYVF